MNVEKFAKEWIEAWNSHDLDKVLLSGAAFVSGLSYTYD